MYDLQDSARLASQPAKGSRRRSWPGWWSRLSVEGGTPGKPGWRSAESISSLSRRLFGFCSAAVVVSALAGHAGQGRDISPTDSGFAGLLLLQASAGDLSQPLDIPYED